MSKTLKFSIIVPIYNVESYLDKCIQSVISQTFTEYELILVDDGSPDTCPQKCDEWADKDSRIKVIHKQNGGQSSARNIGIENANGEYLVFIDSDDYWCDTNLLKDLSIRIDRFEEDVILYGCKILREDGSFEVTRSDYDRSIINYHEKERTLELLFSQGNFPGAAWIYAIRRSIIINNNIRFTEGVSAEDFEWVVNSLVLSKTIGVINGVQYVYVKHEGSVTTKAKFAHIKGTVNAFERYYELGKKYSAIDKFLARVYLLSVMSYNQLSSKDKKLAAPLLRKYTKVLREARQNKYYWFVKIFGLRISSFAINEAYKIVR